jgi:pantetheine-phosphate adenylyltransferase
MMMKIFIYPGTFDPFTKGHADIARRAVSLCDKLFVAVLTNSSKNVVFSVSERVQMTRISLEGIANIEVEAFEGLLVDYFQLKNASAVVRGLRSESDFRYEAELAAANKLLCPSFESVLLPCRMDLAFTSSSIVKEVAAYGGNVSEMVASGALPIIVSKFPRNK